MSGGCQPIWPEASEDSWGGGCYKESCFARVSSETSQEVEGDLV